MNSLESIFLQVIIILLVFPALAVLWIKIFCLFRACVKAVIRFILC